MADDAPLPFLADLGTDGHLAFVADRHGRLVGVVECIVRPPGDTAEIACAVADDHHDLGLATALFEHMTALARTRGVVRFVAGTAVDNVAMRAVFAEAGLPERTHTAGGVVDVAIDLAPPPAAITPRAPAAPSGPRRALGAARAVAVMSGGPVIALAAVLASAAISVAELIGGNAPPLGATVVLALGGIYVVGFVPWTRRWGTVPAECAAVLPGDEFVTDPGLEMTRAITIDAPPDVVWGWLAQIGADRGGFYSHAWLENLAGCRLRNADRVHPEWEHGHEGEVVVLHPLNAIPITRLERPWSFAMGGWYFVLEARPGGRTRLIARTRVPRGPASWAYATFVELPHFVMERRMLRGLKARVEAATQPVPGTAMPAS
jgi:hypothetical protein